VIVESNGASNVEEENEKASVGINKNIAITFSQKPGLGIL